MVDQAKTVKCGVSHCLCGAEHFVSNGWGITCYCDLHFKNCAELIKRGYINDRGKYIGNYEDYKLWLIRQKL